jgi:hypothetical protein
LIEYDYFGLIGLDFQVPVQDLGAFGYFFQIRLKIWWMGWDGMGWDGLDWIG